MIIAAAGLNFVEWGFLGLYFVAVLAIGLYFVRRSSKSTDSYFLAGRSLPWWLAGVSGLYGFLFAIGYIVVWRWPIAILLLVISAVSTAVYFKLFYSLTHYDDQQLEMSDEKK